MNTCGYSVNTHADPHVHLEWSGFTSFLRDVGSPWNGPINKLEHTRTFLETKGFLADLNWINT